MTAEPEVASSMSLSTAATAPATVQDHVQVLSSSPSSSETWLSWLPPALLGLAEGAGQPAWRTWIAELSAFLGRWKQTLKDKYLKQSELDVWSICLTAVFVISVLAVKSIAIMLLYNYAAPRLLPGRTALAKEIGPAVALTLVILSVLL